MGSIPSAPTIFEDSHLKFIYPVVDWLFGLFMWLLLTPGAFYAVCVFCIVVGVGILIADFYNIWKVGRAA